MTSPATIAAALAAILLRLAAADVVSPEQGSWTPQRTLNETLARVSFRYQPKGGANGPGVIRIALFDQHAEPQSSKYYLIALRAGPGGSSLLRCGGRASRRRERSWGDRVGIAPVDTFVESPLPRSQARVCPVAMLFGPEGDAFSSWEPGREYSVVVEADKGLIRIWLDGRMWEWIDAEPFGIFWYRLMQDGMDGSFDREDALTGANNAEKGVGCVVTGGCRCIVGFEGSYCKTLCKRGRYGQDCASSCGRCLGATCDPSTGHCRGFVCDPFTGVCPLGCQPGFLPPLCKEEVTRLREAPKVETINTTAFRVSADVQNVVGRGRARAVRLQFREIHEDSWSSLPERPLEEDDQLVAMEVRDLLPGTTYRLRMLLLAAEGDGARDGQWSTSAPETEASTACSVPYNFNYSIYAFVSGPDLRVGWMAGFGAHQCKVQGWRLRLWPAAQAAGANRSNWTGEVRFVKDTQAVLKAPPTYAMLTVQALTSLAELPPSSPVAVVGRPPHIGQVQDLKDVNTGSNWVNITWKPPSCCTAMPLSYTIVFKCVRLVRCAQNCSHTGPFKKLDSTKPLSLLVEGLRSDAEYDVTVRASLPYERTGAESKIRVQTKTAAPAVAPDPKDIFVKKLGSTSFHLHWSFPSNCSVLHWSADRAQYSLRPALPGPALPGEGPWPMEGEAESRQPFSRLRPDTSYVATLYYVVNGQGNPNMSTEIFINTLPEGAEEVRVYMTARDRVGLRWKLPEDAELSKLLVGARPAAYANAFADPIADPDAFIPSSELKKLPFERCKTWKAMICATITDLQPDTRYFIKVQPTYYRREGIIDTYFTNTTTVKAITREANPDVPRDLRVENSSSSSLTLRWRAPRAINGVLRNFFVIVHNLRVCCGPNVVSVIDTHPDEQEFTHEVKDLPPSSTFLVSVTAVTSTVGPSTNVTAHTAPAVDDVGRLDAPRPVLELVRGPGRCLRLRLPDPAVADLPMGVVRRLFSFFVINVREEGVQGRRTASRIPNSIHQGAQRDAVVSAMPPDFHALTEILQEPENGTVCATMPEGLSSRWQRNFPKVGLLSLFEYEGVYSTAVWQSEAFTLLDCFSSSGSQPGFWNDTYSCF